MDQKELVVKHRIGNSGVAITWIFTLLTMEFWGIYAGIFTGPTTLAVGTVQIACFAPYLIGSIAAFNAGDDVNGNAFLIFSTAFGGIGGFCNVLAGLAEIFGWEICTQMTGIPFIWTGIIIFPISWIIRKTADAVTQVCYLCAAFFLALGGFVTIGVLNAPFWAVIIKWLGLVTALTGFYASISGMLVCGGCKGLPSGKPFFK